MRVRGEEERKEKMRSGGKVRMWRNCEEKVRDKDERNVLLFSFELHLKKIHKATFVCYCSSNFSGYDYFTIFATKGRRDGEHCYLCIETYKYFIIVAYWPTQVEVKSTDTV